MEPENDYFSEEEFFLEDYERLYALITGGVEIKGKTYFLRNELELFFGEGNKEAGKRVRLIMQKIRFFAKDTRDNVQSFKRDML